MTPIGLRQTMERVWDSTMVPEILQPPPIRVPTACLEQAEVDTRAALVEAPVESVEEALCRWEYRQTAPMLG